VEDVMAISSNVSYTTSWSLAGRLIPADSALN
jgi:hypothetical protein